MSDVEKAISGLVEDEELLQNHQHHQKLPKQQSTRAHFSKININNYNLQNATGNSSLLQKQTCHNVTQHHHRHNQQQEAFRQDTNTHTHTHSNSNNSSYLAAKQQHNCLSRVAKLIFSTPGLVVMVVAYTVMGAFIFPLLEAPQDISKSALIAKSREECLKELWIITEKLNVLYERNWTMLVHEQLRRFEGTIVAATRNMASGVTAAANSGVTNVGVAGGLGGGGGEGYGMATEKTATTATTTNSVGRYGGSNLMEYTDLTATRWSFSEALLYSVTVITTIGHGSLTPRTAAGKIATILYALIGVPLMLMCLSSLGALLAEALQCTYARLCCHWPQYEMADCDDLQPKLSDSKHSKADQPSKYHPNQMRRKAELNAEITTTHQIKQCLPPHECDYQNINCKNCKYDAIIGDTNTNHGYDYKLCNDATTTTTATASSLSFSPGASASATASTTTTTTAMTTMKLGHKEDCCQLLQNSPGKLNQHLSFCMQQLKMSPTMSGGSATETTKPAALQQHQQQQQQYYQQRPDVMLMTTGHNKLSSQQPTTMATACHMVLPPSLPSSQTARFYANATPAFATYHLVSSASANSSPTHQQAIRHYIVPQMTTPPPPPPAVAVSHHQQPSKSSTSVTGTQHFMAVPSTMIRLHHHHHPHPHPISQQQNCVGNTSSNVNPLTLPVSGPATVYFPIITPAAGAGGGSAHNSTPPLIKYHTIQMPHKRQQHALSLFQQHDLHDNQLINTIQDVEEPLFPPPPPPAYQTATVHGIRRAKFLTKPLPQEINNLLHESDISCGHDLSQNLTAFSSNSQTSAGGEQQQHVVTSPVYTPTPATHSVMMMSSNENGTKTEISMTAETTTTTATAVNNFYGNSNNNTLSNTDSSSSPASTVTPPIANNTQANPNTTHNITNIYENEEEIAKNHQQQQGHAVNNQTSLILVSGGTTSEAAAASATMDIMEDEEEQEQQRLGNCPHGTPSRVPLLTSSSNSPEQKSHTRGFLNATAASFHRHTLNTFNRNYPPPMPQHRKSVIINRKGECNLQHTPKRRYSSSAAATSCYGQQYADDTSDDDCGGLEGTNIYQLKHLQPAVVQCSRTQTDKQHGPTEFCDNHSLVSGSETAAQLPQVPILVVLLILIFYVCLGTMIFALWENWSLIDGAYFCFVTLTTIGYGDFMPWRTFQGPDIQLFACCAYLLLGLVLVAMAFSILETQLLWKCKRLAVRLKLAKE